MNRNRYPKNWEAIALSIKTSAEWKCGACNKQCLRPGEGSELSRSDKAKATLTVHHADFTPENNAINNLLALCAPCHLAIHSRQRTGNVSPGQLSLQIKENDLSQL
jgi:predicted HNH restriction endonuclease